MARYIETNEEQLQLVVLNFKELYSEDHVLRKLLGIVRRLDLSLFDENYNNDSVAGGRPALPVDRMLALIIYGILYGGLTMRRIAAEIDVRADLIYLSGGLKFDHSSLSVFRKRHEEAIKELFNQTVFIGVESGIIDMKLVHIDGSKVKGCANRSGLMDREGLEKRYKYLEGVSEKLYERWARREEESEREGLKRKEEALKKEKEKVERALKFLEESGRKRVHINERDVDWQVSGGKFIIGYNAQVAVDDKSGMIVHQDVVREQADCEQTIKMIGGVEKIKVEIGDGYGEGTKYVLDSGYSSGANLKELEEKGIEVYMPDKEYARLIGGKKRPEEREGIKIGPPSVKREEKKYEGYLCFRYESGGDNFRCIGGGELKYYREVEIKGVKYREYRRYGCKGCEHAKKCLGEVVRGWRKSIVVKEEEFKFLEWKKVRAHKVRDGGRSEYELALAMREKLGTEEGRRIYGRRFCVAEGTFGIIKTIRGGDKFLRKGLQRVREEWAERCIAHNIGKIIGFRLERLKAG